MFGSNVMTYIQAGYCYLHGMYLEALHWVHDSKLEKQQWVHNLAKHFVEEMHLLKGNTNSPPCFLEVIGQRIFSIIAFFAK